MEQDLPPPPPFPPHGHGPGPGRQQGLGAGRGHGPGGRGGSSSGGLNGAGSSRGGGSGHNASRGRGASGRSSSGSSSSGGAFLERRPGFGTLGTPTQIVANHFRVRFRARKIYHYDVTIEPEPGKGQHRDIINQAVNMYRTEKMDGAQPAYDGQRALYIAKPLPQELELSVELAGDSDAPRRRRNQFKVTLRKASVLDMKHLEDFLQGRQRMLPQETLQALDIVLREAASKYFVPRGRCFFGKSYGSNDIPGGLVAYSGFYQSIRPAQDNLLTLNIDIAAAPFLPAVLLPDFLGNAFQKDPRDLANELSRPDAYGDANRVKARKLLKGIRIETVHNQGAKRKYRIQGISSEPLHSLRFDMNGENITVEDYFWRTYGYKMRLPGLPAIESGTKEKKRYLPMEVCRIVDGQPYVKTMNENQKKALLGVTCVRPEDRRRTTEQIEHDLEKNTRSIAAEFGVEINKMSTRINARVLPSPAIQYQTNQVVPGEEGSWNMKNRMMVNGCTIRYWSLINFSHHLNEREVNTFCTRLPQICDSYGLSMNPTMAVRWIAERGGNAEAAIKHLNQMSLQAMGQELELLICIMPQIDNKVIYATVKRVCEIELGLVTQCCLSDHVKKCRPEYIANLLLKINAKLGGYNALLVDEKNKKLPLISEVPSIIIGADVSHPRVGDDYSPSISAVAASMDWPNFSHYEAIVQTQRQRGEVCEELYWEREDQEGSKQTGGILKDLLWSFYEKTAMKPERIIFYRDGVSEGEFEAVLNNEMEAVKKACESLGWGTRAHNGKEEEGSKRPRLDASLPKITFIVVQKRHHTRFFPNDNKRTKNGNILPGTIVDSGICHPSQFDFFLCSHFGIKGTSRPAHYHVLRDENNFNVDQIQRLTNDLCFTYARCTRAVSIVPPCYYAHLAATRARLWISSGGGSDYSSQHDAASSMGGSARSGFSRGRAVLRPLPELHQRIKGSMFYI